MAPWVCLRQRPTLRQIWRCEGAIYNGDSGPPQAAASFPRAEHSLLKSSFECLFLNGCGVLFEILQKLRSLRRFPAAGMFIRVAKQMLQPDEIYLSEACGTSRFFAHLLGNFRSPEFDIKICFF